MVEGIDDALLVVHRLGRLLNVVDCEDRLCELRGVAREDALGAYHGGRVLARGQRGYFLIEALDVVLVESGIALAVVCSRWELSRLRETRVGLELVRRSCPSHFVPYCVAKRGRCTLHLELLLVVIVRSVEGTQGVGPLAAVGSYAHDLLLLQLMLPLQGIASVLLPRGASSVDARKQVAASRTLHCNDWVLELSLRCDTQSLYVWHRSIEGAWGPHEQALKVRLPIAVKILAAIYGSM